MYKLIYVCLFTVVSLGCQQVGVETITADDLKKLQSEGVTVIDIRTLREYNKGHIPQVVHVDYYSSDFVKAITSFKNQPIILYCAVGGRSGVASKLLVGEGFKKIYDYSGGFSNWKSLGEKIEK